MVLRLEAPRAMSSNEPIIPHRKVAPGSARSFGLVFSVLFVALALLPLLHGKPARWWALGPAVLLLAAALLAPRLLAPLNLLWFRLGLAMHAVVNPIVMAVMFYGAVVPMGLLLKALGKDLLQLRWQPAAETYWIRRNPPGPAPGSMSKQF